MIPVFEPLIGEREIRGVVAALRRGELSGSFSKTIEKFEERFAAYCDTKFGVAVTSGTTALHLAMAASGIRKNAEVLISACTNIATALAVAHNGMFPVPVDAEDETWNMDLDLVERMITPRTKGIIPVHLYGHPVDMKRLIKIARRHRLVVIEDCAEAHGATCYGKKVGGFGDMGCFSFYANKVITTGEGGMVVTNNKKLAERMRLLRNLAFEKVRFRHRYLGYNFRMTGYQAAMGLAQLARIEKIIARKREIARLYNRYLCGIPGIQLPREAEWAKNIYWMYAVVIKPEFGLSRDALMKRLAQAGIGTRTFFYPMNRQPCLKPYARRKIGCPVAEGLWKTGMYLPSGLNLTEKTIKHVSKTIGQAYAAGK